MKLFRLIPAVTLLLCACNKTPPPAAPVMPEAPRMAEHIAPAAAPSSTPVPDAPPLPPSDDFSINEPMPPVDEEGAPPSISAHGSCKGVDAAHAVSGDITIYDAGSGSRLLRIENLHSPGGATDLGLVHSDAPAAADLAAMAQLGALKGASGNMNYLVERKLELTPPRALVLVARETHALVGYCNLGAGK